MRIKVSSVHNKDVKSFGKQHLVDGSQETCWSSEQGSPQWILVEFENGPQSPEQVQLMFQGGFAGKEVTLSGINKPGSARGVSELDESVWTKCIYPADVNTMQTFGLGPSSGDEALVNLPPVDRIKITFHSSTDMFGRIICYHLGFTLSQA